MVNATKSYRSAMANDRGRMFEAMLLAGCRWYRKAGVAEIDKTPEPFRVSRKLGEGKFEGRFGHAAQPDFQGTLPGGISVIFEAKSTGSDRIQRSVLTQEQMDVLQRHHELGAIAFIAVELDMHMFTVPWPIWRDMRTWFGRKYITHNELKMFEVHYAYSRGVMFLGRVDRMQELRERNIWRE
ncbi:MAG: Holliday junction resolvase RecU [Eubacteriales bacterium]|nr:Holliday junction resolvase RecU [Eubacteriales bacterium]